MTDWLPQRKSNAEALPLICFPFAGGGTAIFHQWRLKSPIEVVPPRLPGREGRVKEPAFDDFDRLMQCLMAELEHLWQTPFALFGYSMGALIAFEIAQRTTAMGRPPMGLFVSACRAPQRLDRDNLAPLFGLPNDQMIDQVLLRYGLQVEADERALMLVLADTLRADLQLFDSYKHRPANPTRLSSPVYACGGADDPVVNRADLEAWQETTDGPFATRVFPGAHFFIRSHHKPLSSFVQEKLLGLI